MGAYFAMQAGNTRAYEKRRPWRWGVSNDGTRVAMEVLSDYRLPPSIHDLFVNDRHRRFFQRLHRIPRSEVAGGRNANNMEIYAGSPSYLITAGGSPSGYAIDPRVAGIVVGDVEQQLGVAVATSFMPTGFGGNARDLIQFGSFAVGERALTCNYGVAPDFACGPNPYLPEWVHRDGDWAGKHDDMRWEEGWLFLCRSPGVREDRERGPGFYLAMYRVGGLALLEAFDTWLHPDVEYGDFVEDVKSRNPSLSLADSEEFEYMTWNGNRVWAVISPVKTGKLSLGIHIPIPLPPGGVPVPGGPTISPSVEYEYGGAEVRRVEYGDRDRADAIGDAGNVKDRFLNGTVMTSPGDAVVQVHNPSLGTTLSLDMSDPWHPRRIAEDGEIEEAGSNHEVWLDFEWSGPSEGDVCRPFKTVAAAIRGVAAGGVIRVVPGATTDRSTIGGEKPVRLVAPIGGVVIGAREGAEPPPISGAMEPSEPVRADDVWVQFGFPESTPEHIRRPFDSLAKAVDAVADGGVVRIVPGMTFERFAIGNRKRFTVTAPIGGVTIGARQTPPSEVWVNFDWPTSGHGGPCDPFKIIADATAAVADGGIVKIMPGATSDRSRIGGPKRFGLIAPTGGVTIGARP
jgi:hypothetical protein